MRIVTIAKGNGRLRILYAPDLDERRMLGLHMDFLREEQERVLAPCVHGFRVKRSPITNALPHRDKQWSLSMDLESFFDSVTVEHLDGVLPRSLLTEVREGGVLYSGAPRQGLPTSPFVANLAAAALDRDILLLLALTEVVYTRYADDLSFSWNGDRSLHEWLRIEVSRVVRSHRFALAKGKTHLQSSIGGRRVICGVAVGRTLHAKRLTRRRLRSAEHRVKIITNERAFIVALGGPENHKLRLAHRQQAGLRAWCSMTPPKEKK